MKKLILSTGEKGGVGKSFFARTYMASYFLENGTYPTCFDTDQANPTFSRFYGEMISHLDLNNIETFDVIIDKFEDGEQVVLVDGAARSLESLITWMNSVSITDILEDLGIEVDIYFVITDGMDSLNLLYQYTEVFNMDRFNWNVVLNKINGSEFEAYYKSNTRKRIMDELQGKEITLPLLSRDLSSYLDESGIPFESFLDDSSARMIKKQRVKSFLRQFNEYR